MRASSSQLSRSVSSKLNSSRALSLTPSSLHFVTPSVALSHPDSSFSASSSLALFSDHLLSTEMLGSYRAQRRGTCHRPSSELSLSRRHMSPQSRCPHDAALVGKGPICDWLRQKQPHGIRLHGFFCSKESSILCCVMCFDAVMIMPNTKKLEDTIGFDAAAHFVPIFGFSLLREWARLTFSHTHAPQRIRASHGFRQLPHLLTP